MPPANATYYYDDGRRDLQSLRCHADENGALTRPGETAPFCTGATPAAVPTSGHYVIDITATAEAEAAAAAEAAAEAEAAAAAEAAAEAEAAGEPEASARKGKKG